MMGEHESSDRDKKPVRDFRNLGRKSLLGRDSRTGLPRGLRTGPIDPEGLRDDLHDRLKEVIKKNKPQEE
jgi:hypothetical protein